MNSQQSLDEKPAATSGELVFYFSAIVIVAACVAATAAFCRTMSGGMTMPGGWTMSMMWMRMPGQTWSQAAAMFMTMWLAMMVAMMGPSVQPMLASTRRGGRAEGRASAGLSLAFLAGGYYFVYLAMGAIAYPLGMALGLGAMRWPALSRAVPFISGGALVAAGFVQWSSWKMSCLRQCRDPLACGIKQMDGTKWQAWKQGVQLGVSCVFCCSGLMLILFVLGMMNPVVLLVVTLAITAERLAPRPEPVAKISGLAAVLTGMVMLLHPLFHF